MLQAMLSSAVNFRPGEGEGWSLTNRNHTRSHSLLTTVQKPEEKQEEAPAGPRKASQTFAKLVFLHFVAGRTKECNRLFLCCTLKVEIFLH